MILKKKFCVRAHVHTVPAGIRDLGSREFLVLFRNSFEYSSIFFFLEHFQESSLELGTQVSKSSPVLHFILQPSQCMEPDARTESITSINIRGRREE